MKILRLLLVLAVALPAVISPRPVRAQLLPGIGQIIGQDDNCDEKLEEKRTGWNAVIGKQINEGHYAEALLAIWQSIKERDVEPISDFFGDTIDQVMDSMGDDLEELGEQAIFDLIMGALAGNGKSIQQGRMTIEGGLMECQRWKNISLEVPTDLLDCEVVYQGIYTRVECPSTDFGTKIPLLPLYYPYVRYRVDRTIQFPLEHLDEAYATVSDELDQVEEQIADYRSQGFSQSEIADYASKAVEDAIANAIVSLASRYLEQIDIEDSREIIRQSVASALLEASISAQSTAFLDEARANIQELIAGAAGDASEYVIDTIRARPAAFVFDWATTNEGTVKATIEEPGWHLVWGQKIDEVEYTALGAALIAAPASGGASIAAYFGAYLQRTLDKVQRQAPELGREVVLQLLNDMAEALRNGDNPTQSLVTDDFTIEADFISYQRHILFNYPKVGVEGCDWQVDFGQLGKLTTKGLCTQGLGPGVEKIPLPNHHQPYIRFRLNNGRSAKPTGPDQGATQPVFFPNRHAPNTKVSGTVAADGDRLNVRSAPAPNAEIIGKLPDGAAVTATSRSADSQWLRIRTRLANQDFGWVMAAFVQLSQPISALPVFSLSDELQSGGESETAGTGQSVAPPTGTIAVPVFDTVRETYDVWLVNADGTNLRKVISEASSPALSLDGSALAYRRWKRDDRGIVIAGIDGGNPLRLTANLEDILPSFSPDGRRIIFSSYRDGDRRSRIYYVWYDERNYKTWEWNGGGVYGKDPSWAADGGIVYVGLRPGPELRAMDDGGGNIRAIMPPDPSVQAPAVSPDGRRIAYMLQADGDYEIFVANRDGTNPVRLTQVAAKDGLPAWSPAGNHIAFVSDRSGQWALWIMQADGSNPALLVNLPGSVDGRVRNEMPYLTNGWIEEQLAWSR